MDDFPPLVERAYDVARRVGFPLTPPVGGPRLVSVEVVLPDLRNALLVGTRGR